MKSFELKISSPEGDLYCGKAVKLVVRAAEGELAVMAGHIPFVTYLKPCEAKIELEDGSEKFADLESGILTVSTEKTILLSGDFKWKEKEPNPPTH